MLGEDAATTVTVPVIEEWMLQWYVKVPAASNAWLNVAPGARLPLSKEPSSAVTVWAVLSWFVQVTVEPTGTLIEAGPNAKLLMVTAVADAGAPALGAGLISMGAIEATGEASARRPTTERRRRRRAGAWPPAQLRLRSTTWSSCPSSGRSRDGWVKEVSVAEALGGPVAACRGRTADGR